MTVGTTAVSILATNPNRRGFSIQNQSATAICYIRGDGTATADFNSIQIGPGVYYETPTTLLSVGALSIVCSAATTPVNAREW